MAATSTAMTVAEWQHGSFKACAPRQACRGIAVWAPVATGWRRFSLPSAMPVLFPAAKRTSAVQRLRKYRSQELGLDSSNRRSCGR